MAYELRISDWSSDVFSSDLIIFPAFTIGLASWLVVLEARWLKTRDEAWKRLYRFWLKIFAVSFGLGVVSGVVLSSKFGTNWGPFSVFAGEVIGPLMTRSEARGAGRESVGKVRSGRWA